jgi:hypothetical protein
MIACTRATLVGREAALPRVLAPHRLVGRLVDAAELVVGHVAGDPLDLGTHAVHTPRDF